MRIYKVGIEHKTYGDNWRSVNIAARNAVEAIRRTQKTLNTREIVESVNLIAAED